MPCPRTSRRRCVPTSSGPVALPSQKAKRTGGGSPTVAASSGLMVRATADPSSVRGGVREVSGWPRRVSVDIDPSCSRCPICPAQQSPPTVYSQSAIAQGSICSRRSGQPTSRTARTSDRVRNLRFTGAARRPQGFPSTRTAAGGLPGADPPPESGAALQRPVADGPTAGSRSACIRRAMADMFTRGGLRCVHPMHTDAATTAARPPS